MSFINFFIASRDTLPIIKEISLLLNKDQWQAEELSRRAKTIKEIFEKRVVRQEPYENYLKISDELISLIEKENKKEVSKIINLWIENPPDISFAGFSDS